MCSENGSDQPGVSARVLVVDDEVLICEGLSKILRRLGHTADVSYSPDDALARLEVIDYDVMILDLQMPGASAQETLQRARQLRSRLRVIVLSGQSSREQLNATVGHEVDDCLVKPATATEIDASISMVLRGRQ
jgi:DNA-binding response OmpR family regulator